MGCGEHQRWKELAKSELMNETPRSETLMDLEQSVMMMMWGTSRPLAWLMNDEKSGMMMGTFQCLTW